MLRGQFRMMMSNIIAGVMVDMMIYRHSHSHVTHVTALVLDSELGCSWEQHSNNFASAPEMKLNTKNKKARKINSMKVQR
jgi:hypothetical protein